MKKFFVLFALAAAFSASAFANGNGAGADGGSTGAGNGAGYGLPTIGNVPNIQTMNPIEKERIARKMQAEQAKAAPPEALKFPAWVQN
jgi:deoxyxylulose-5-phosphate synthase